MKLIQGAAIILTLAICSCSKGDTSEPVSVNGYSVDNVAYRMDTMSFDSSYKELRIHSGDHGGATVYLYQTKAWPTVNGTYQYAPFMLLNDSTGVGIRFKYDSSSTIHHTVALFSTPGVIYSLDKGKRKVTLSGMALDDANGPFLKISAAE